MTKPGVPNLDQLLAQARAHGEMTDTHGWVSDLEDMLRAAWSLLTDEQRLAFADHPDILAIGEAAGESS